ncbi:ribonuclease H-like domain-containing protein [Tanacetum coccineum]
MYSFFANQSSGPQLDHEDLEQVDEFNLEEMDLKWQVVMISMRLKKFYKNTRRKLQFDAKEPVGFDKTKVECFNCHKIEHFASECRSKGNQESRRRDAGNTGYKARDNGRRPTKHDEPKAMVTNDGDGVDWTGHAEDDQMSAKDKSRLGYGDQIHEGVLSYENEVLQSVFDSKSSDVEDSPVNDRFANVKGMHAVPLLMTGIYMPPRFDFGIDESMFTYGPKKSKTSESDAETRNYASCESNSSVETLESIPKPVVNEPKTVSAPKVWSDAPIIEEYESDNDDEYVQTVKEQDTCSQNPKVDKRDWNGLMSKRLGLGYGFTRKACFVCGSFSHLIRDCDFHEKRMTKHVELNKQKGKGTGTGENRLLVLLGAIGKLLLRPQQIIIGDPKDITGTNSPNTIVDQTLDNPHTALKNKGIANSGCSRHMTRNKDYLVEYQDYNGGHVAFGGSKGQITGKGKISTGKLDSEDVYFVKEL